MVASEHRHCGEQHGKNQTIPGQRVSYSLTDSSLKYIKVADYHIIKQKQIDNDYA